MADLLRGEFPNDLVARFGGEEFCILSTSDSESSFNRFDEFRRKVADSRVDENNYQFGFSISIGISSVHNEKLDASIHAADLNLYRAKEQGRNQVVTSCQP
jgi:diguanylate cyclase (GGDEF)-like protein